MRASRITYYGLMVCGAVVLWPLLSLAITVPSIDQIPDGYRAGRQDAVAGAYDSVFGPAAQPLHERMIRLQNKAYGLSLMVDDDPVVQSEMVLLMEAETIRLFLDVVEFDSAKMTVFERNALLYGTTHVYQVIRGDAERLFEDMVRFIDGELPGANGAQLRQDLVDSDDSIYLPNYRSDKPLTPEERATLYQAKRREFLNKGGNLAEIKQLNDTWLRSIGAYTRVEYVELEDGGIFVTEGTAGHVLLAAGAPVLAAGQLIFLKEPSGQISMVVVSNSSGNFKPDLFSAEKLSQRVQAMASVPPERVVLTKGEPMSSQAVKIFMKGQFKDKDVIDQTVKGMEERVNQILSPSEDCAGLLLRKDQKR